MDRVVIRDGDAISALLAPAGRPRVDAGVGGAPDASRGARDGEPASRTRRREPAHESARAASASARSRGPSRSSATTSPTTCSTPAGCGSRTSRPGLEVGSLADRRSPRRAGRTVRRCWRSRTSAPRTSDPGHRTSLAWLPPASAATHLPRTPCRRGSSRRWWTLPSGSFAAAPPESASRPLSSPLSARTSASGTDTGEPAVNSRDDQPGGVDRTWRPEHRRERTGGDQRLRPHRPELLPGGRRRRVPTIESSR